MSSEELEGERFNPSLNPSFNPSDNPSFIVILSEESY
jgi:hypothetical protein